MRHKRHKRHKQSNFIAAPRSKCSIRTEAYFDFLKRHRASVAVAEEYAWAVSDIDDSQKANDIEQRYLKYGGW